MTKHVSKAGKVDPGHRVTLPVKFAWKPGDNFSPHWTAYSRLDFRSVIEISIYLKN